MLNVIETSTKQTYIIRPLLSALPLPSEGLGEACGGGSVGGFLTAN